MSKVYRGRLAPSPTGYLHLGHAATFLDAQARARVNGGTLVLRIEDLDRQRSRPAFVEALIEDMRWVGLDWQEGPDVGGPFAPYRQSERMPLYLDAWRRLAATGAIYPCFCTRRDVGRAAQAPHGEEREPVYPGCCRPARTQAVQASEPGGANWRYRILEGETVSFIDNHGGPKAFVAGQDFGDFLVWRKDNVPAYQLAVVVDDAAMRISEVVRGADLLLSTAQQLLLYRALACEPPAFCHLPLITDAAGVRLAKRTGAHSLRALRAAGVESGSLWNLIGERCTPFDADGASV